MLPHARMMTCPPRMNRSFGSTVNMMIRAQDLEYNTQVCCFSRNPPGLTLVWWGAERDSRVSSELKDCFDMQSPPTYFFI